MDGLNVKVLLCVWIFFLIVAVIVTVFLLPMSELWNNFVNPLYWFGIGLISVLLTFIVSAVFDIYEWC